MYAVAIHINQILMHIRHAEKHRGKDLIRFFYLYMGFKSIFTTGILNNQNGYFTTLNFT